MLLRFSKQIYSKTALLKAAYSFTNRAYIHLDATDNDFIVNIELKLDVPDFSEKDFINEMLHQAVRFDVYLKTKTIRELLMARAMASTVIENPETPALTPEDTSFDINEILTDWFELHE